MSMHILDELPVPQPPYRMKRPVAVLAVAEEPVIASTEGEALLPPTPEAPPPVLEGEPASVAEAVAERAAAIEASAEAARAQIEQAPALADAAPEEAQQDADNRQAAVAQVESAKVEGAAGVQQVAERAYDTTDDLERERDRLMAIAQQEGIDSTRGGLAMKGAVLLAPMIEKKRAATQLVVEQQPAPAPAAEAPAAPQEAKVPVSQMKKREGESEGEFRQRKYAEKTPAKQKEEASKSQTAAIAEDAARDDQKIESGEGLEFKQPQETAAQKAGRIGREALEKLNAFKDLQEKKGATPQELEFARQQADLSQKQAEAAKRGEAIPEDKVDMAKVEAAGAQPKPEGNPDQARWTAEWTKEIKDAESFEDLYAKMRDAGEYLVSPSTGKPVDIEREIAIIENYRKTGNQFMPVEGGIGQPTRGLGVREKVVALRAKEQPEKPKVKPTADELEAYQRKLRGEETPAPAAPTGLEDAFDAEGNLKLVPLEETPQKAPAEIGSEQVNIKPGSPEGDAVAAARSEAESAKAAPAEVGSERVNIKPGTPEGDAVAAARAAAEKVIAEKQTAPVEAAPAEVRMSQEEFERKLAEARSQGAAEARPSAGPERTEGEPRPPGRVSEALRDADPIGAETLEKSLNPSRLKRFWEQTVWTWKDVLGWAATGLEKRAKDMLAERDETIKQLEEEAAAHAGKSWLGSKKSKWSRIPGVRTIIKPLIEAERMGNYQAKLAWHRWRRESISAAVQNNAAYRKAFEDGHLNAINNVVSQQEAVVGIAEQKERKDAAMVKKYEEMLDGLEKARSAAQEAFVSETDFAVKKKLRDDLRQILADIDEATAIREKYGDQLARSSVEATNLRAEQNVLLKKAGQQERPVAEEGARLRLQPRAKRKVNQTTAA